MLGEAASRALRNSTPDPSFGGPEFFCADTAAGAGLNAAGTGAGSGNRDVPGAGTGTRRERERERAGERAPGRGQERREASGAEGRGTSAGAGTGAEAIKGAERGQRGGRPGDERRGGDRSGDRPAGAGSRGTSAGAGTGAEAIKGAERGQRGRKAAGERAPEVTENDVVLPRKGSIPVRQCPRAACSPATPLRQLPPPLRRDATPSAHRPAALHHPSLHTSANFPSPAPPRGLFLPRSARSCSLPEGPKRPPAGPGTGSHRPKYAQPTHRPNTHKKRAASAAGCRPMERMRRLYSRSSPVSSATGGS